MASTQNNIQFKKEECPVFEETLYYKQNLISQDNRTFQLLEGNSFAYSHVTKAS